MNGSNTRPPNHLRLIGGDQIERERWRLDEIRSDARELRDVLVSLAQEADRISRLTMEAD